MKSKSKKNKKSKKSKTKKYRSLQYRSSQYRSSQYRSSQYRSLQYRSSQYGGSHSKETRQKSLHQLRQNARRRSLKRVLPEIIEQKVDGIETEVINMDAQLHTLPTPPPPPPLAFPDLELVPLVPRPFPEFIRYVPIMPDGRILNANGVDVTGHYIPIPPTHVPAPPSGPIPDGVPTITANGYSKTVFYQPNSAVAYITSTLGQMALTQDTNQHFKEELILTQIEHFLFPDLILGAYHKGPENDERIGAYRQTNPNDVFIYKKDRVLESEVDSPGILEFIIESIFRLSNDRLGEPVPLSFTNLDIKPSNIGILPDGRFIYLDNGCVFFYPIPIEFQEYYESASLIIGLCSLWRIFNDEELELIRSRLSREQMYNVFRRRLTVEEKIYITEYAQRFFIAQGLPLTAEKYFAFPEVVMRNFCKMSKTTLADDDYLGKFRQTTIYNQLDRL